jgi:hypothetical protein
MKYVVHVQRVVRLRYVGSWVLGPYRWRWQARFVAWLQYISNDNVHQDGKVYVQGTEPKPK